MAGAALILGAAVGGCSDGRPGWCDDLAERQDLDALVTAVVADDTAAAEEALSDLEELAESAPAEISDEMEAVVALVEEVVDIRLAGDEVSEAELERRREHVNQQLAEVTDRTAAVSRWAEQQCGLQLD